jgi:hypothetical protein
MSFSRLFHQGLTTSAETAYMQTGDLVICGAALLLLALLCVRLALRHPDPQETQSLEELEKKVELQEEEELEHRKTRGRGAP